ncbi:MAG: hypothetical protein WC004_02325 [Candidatus Absconditabacterales bacterium]
MRKITSKQRDILFLLCKSPITIDKSAEWGPGNSQLAPDGAFLKINEGEGGKMDISHLVQPNPEKTAPIGWVSNGQPNRFDKAPIWVDQKILNAGETVALQTADGPINYQVTEASYLCYNDKEGMPNLQDSWVQTRKNLEKNYEF